MSEISVIFKSLEEVLDFLNKVEKYPFEMDLSCGSIVVDAKSLIGIMYIGFNHIVNLKVYNDECNSLREDIKKFIAA